MYNVFLTDHAKQNLTKLKKHGKRTLEQLRSVLGELARDPHAMTQEFHAPLQGYRSLHVGRFRAVIKIVEKEVRVYVVGIGWHESGSREDIYQQIHRALLSGAIKFPRPENQ
jgi:mRNA-degrading endonuclease RelE of RelBE toxin-antitoxin system